MGLPQQLSLNQTRTPCTIGLSPWALSSNQFIDKCPTAKIGFAVCCHDCFCFLSSNTSYFNSDCWLCIWNLWYLQYSNKRLF